MMKIIIYTLVIFTFIRCQQAEKSKKLNSDGKIECSNNLNDLKIFFRNDSIVSLINYEKGYEVIFEKGNINKILRFALFDSNYVTEEINFDLDGVFLDYLCDNKEENESYSITNKSDHVQFAIMKKFKVSDHFEPITHLNVNKTTKDTFNYFYYKSVNGKGFQLYTDLEDLVFDPSKMDSVVIDYVEHSLTEKNYYAPDSTYVLPNLKGMNEKTVVNSLFVPTTSSIAIGTLWTYNKPKSSSLAPYVYYFLYLQGNSLQRLKEYQKQFYAFADKHNYQTTDNRKLVKDIVESGYYKLEGNKLVRDRKGEK